MTLPPPPPPPVAPRTMVARTNSFAVAAFTCSLSTILIGFGWIPGLVFGYMALRQIEADPGQGGRRLALAGVVLGWIGAVVLLFAVIIYAAVPEARNG